MWSKFVELLYLTTISPYVNGHFPVWSYSHCIRLEARVFRIVNWKKPNLEYVCLPPDPQSYLFSILLSGPQGGGVDTWNFEKVKSEVLNENDPAEIEDGPIFRQNSVCSCFEPF